MRLLCSKVQPLDDICQPLEGLRLVTLQKSGTDAADVLIAAPCSGGMLSSSF